MTSEPFRLDDASTAVDPFAFTFRGVRYVMPALQAWPLGVLDMAVGGRLEPALAALLGEDAADRLVADGMTVGHMMALLEAMARPA